MSLRILFISGTYPPAKCGVGDYTYNLVNTLSSLNDTEIHVITSSYLGISVNNCNPFIYPVIDNWRSARIIFNKLKEIIKSVKPDIIHFQYLTKEYEKYISISILPVFIKSKFPKLKVVETFHEPVFHSYWKAKIRYLPALAATDGLIFVDEEYYNNMPAIYKLLTRKKHRQVIYVASNIPHVCLKNEEIDNLRGKLNITKKELLFAYFGAITKYRGLESFIEILKRVESKLLIISSLKEENIYHAQLLSIFKKEGISERIIITGFLPSIEVAKKLCIADACIFPQLGGISPKNTSVLAALNQGVFTIATSKTASGYSPKTNLYHVAPGDTEEMIRALKEYAGKRIIPDFQLLPDWKHIARDHNKFYKNILGEKD